MLKKFLKPILACQLMVGAAAAYGIASPPISYEADIRATERLDLRSVTASSSASRQTALPAGTKIMLNSMTDEAGRGALHATEETAMPLSLKNAPRGAVSSAQQLEGKWINQYPMLIGSYTGAATANFTTTEGSNQITISNFWRTGGKVTATLNATGDTLTIPSQVVTTRTDGVKMSVAPVNMTNGRPLRTQALKAVITSDGMIICDTPWGIFYDATQPNGGDNPAFEKDDYANVYTYMTFERGTSTMSHTNSTRNETLEYPIIATQISSNVLRVKNFLGYGQTVDLILNRDKSYTCRTQIGMVEGSTAYYTRGDIVLNSDNAPASWNTTFSFAAGTDPKLIQFSNMSLFYSNSYWIGLITDARINLPFDIAFPDPYTPLDGEGTQSNPYLIKTYNDLCNLAEMVNSDESYNYNVISGTDTIKVSRPFLGKYFRLMADLDMQNYDFTPIGNGTHFFAGDFDGNGHVIKGANIYGDDGYAALFGYVDAKGSIRNLSLENITVNAAKIYSAALVSRCDGNIDNCHVRNSSITVRDGYQGAAALAGTVYSISNSTVNDCEVYAGDGYGGGLAVQAFGPITNCHVSGTTITGKIYNSQSIPPFGGITATATDAITDCSFAGVIQIPYSYFPATIGGIAGIISSLDKGVGLTRTIAAGRFIGSSGNYANQNRIGGLAGACAAHITDSYASGEARASGALIAGGLTGMVQYMKNSTTGAVTQPIFARSYSNVWLNVGSNGYTPSANTCQELIGSSDPSNPPTITDSYFNSDITDLGSSQHKLTTAELTSASGPAGFNADAWLLTANAYPRLKSMQNKPVSDLTASAILFTNGATRERLTSNLQITTIGDTEFGYMVNGKFTKQGYYSSIEGNTLKLNDELRFGYDTIVSRCGNATQLYAMMMAPTPWEGNGSEATPWLIKNKADMLALCKMTSESRISFPGTYFKMTADIDMEYDEAFTGISYTNTEGRVLFHGTFDGDGHTIHKLRIGHLDWKVRPEDDPAGKGTVNTTTSMATYIGLFGEIAFDGVVRNVNIASDCKYEIFASGGSIAGYNYGLIENCRNYADITGQSSWIGGIAGQIARGGTIRNCYNAGNVTSGYRNAGGITSQTQGQIIGCANTGDVRVISLYQAPGRGYIMYAGGISGGINGGEILDCYNAGNVYALEGYAGGIAGIAPLAASNANFSNGMSRNLNVGVVESGVSQKSGGIAGGSGTVGDIVNNYYDASLNPQGGIESSNEPGITGMTTQKLVDGTALTGLDATSWTYTAGNYPIPTAYASEPAIAAKKQMYILFAEGQDRIHVQANATLSQVSGLTWKLLTSNGFSINGNTLVIPADAETTICDTVQGTLNGITRDIAVQYLPKAPWEGEGTATNPYRIVTPAHWNAIGTLMRSTGDDYDNTYFLVANDVDFNGEAIEVIGADPASFKGVIDGGNHTLKNFKLDITTTYMGPIGVLDGKGEIRNLTMAGNINVALASGSYAYAGGFVGKCYGRVTNCVNASTITSTKGYIAGIAGHSYAGATFTDCVNRGQIGTTASAGYIGGIVSRVSEGTNFMRCGNEGTLTTTGTTGYIGGIAGESYESRYDSCYNKADIDLPKVSNISGIVGRMAGTNNATTIFYFTGCYNTGNITGKAILGGITSYAVSTVGGAVGQYTGCYNTGNITAICTTTSGNSPAAAGIAAHYKPGSAYINCRNSGTITSESKAYTMGGIAGGTSGVPNAANPVTFENCINTGTIQGLNSDAYWTGGILGHINAYVSIINCGNEGAVSAKYSAGGIAGALYGANSRVENCYNTGDVTVSTRMAGGIIGSMGVTSGNPSTSVVSGCWNSGNISTTSTTVGTTITTTSVDGHAIGGIAGQTASQIEYCANFGNVTGATMVGGIVGEPVKNASAARTVIRGCYNAASITAQPTGVKGGITVTSNATYWSTHNSVTDSYYATDWGMTGSDDSAGTGVTLSDLCKTDIGSAWAIIGDYILPVAANGRDNDGWKAMASAVILRDDNSFNRVTRNFHVGTPAGVIWSVEPANEQLLSQDGNLMQWKKEGYTGDIVLVARCGDFSHRWQLTASETTGIADTNMDGVTPVSQMYFTPDGIQTAQPAGTDGKFYIVVTIYSDGTKTVERIINK